MPKLLIPTLLLLASACTREQLIITEGNRLVARVSERGAIAVEAPGKTSRAPLTLETIADGGGRERLRSHSDGSLEQTWHFDHAPPAGKDVEVIVRFAGQKLKRASDEGLHFETIRYGRATWVDARGVRTPINSDVRGSAIHLALPADLLARSTYPAVLDPLITAETQPDLPIIGPLAFSAQFRPVAASDGSGYFAVWSEVSNRGYVLGTLLDGNGRPVGGTSTKLVEDFGGGAAIAFGGGNYLVAWDNGFAIEAARISPAGINLDPGGLTIVPPRPDVIFWRPSIAFDGSSFFITWFESTISIQDVRLLGARVAPDGTLLDAGGIELARPEGLGEARVVFDGTNFVVGWTDYRRQSPSPIDPATVCADLLALRVSPLGMVLDTEGFALAATDNCEAQLDLHSFGGQTFAAWIESRSPYYDDHGDLRGAILPENSALPVTIAELDTSTDLHLDPKISDDGTELILAWTELFAGDNDLCLRRFTTEGLPGTGPACQRMMLMEQQSEPELVRSSTATLLIWEDFRTGIQAHASILAPDLSPLDPNGVQIALGANDQYDPFVASNGSDYMVTWFDTRAPEPGLWAAQVHGSGAFRGCPFPIGASSAATYGGAIASNGADYFTVWFDQNGITGHRISADGVALDPAGIIVAASPDPDVYFSPPRVVWGDGVYLVVWIQFLPNDPYSLNEVRAARVTADGVVLDATPLVISNQAANHDYPEVAFGGGVWFVVWESSEAFSFVDSIHARSLSTTGTLGGELVVSTSTDSAVFPAIAFDGSNFLVAWQRQYIGPLGYTGDIHARRLTPDAMFLDQQPFEIAALSNVSENGPAIAFDGEHYIVAWTVANLTLDAEAIHVDIAGQLIGSRFLISTGRGYFRSPRIASDGQGNALTVFTRYDRDPELLAERLHARAFTLGNGPLPDLINEPCGTPPPPQDAGVPDASSPDAARDPEPDATVADATTSVPDANGAADASIAADAGVDPVTTIEDDGCSCSSPGGHEVAPSWSWLLFLVLLARRRR